MISRNGGRKRFLFNYCPLYCGGHYVLLVRGIYWLDISSIQTIAKGATDPRVKCLCQITVQKSQEQKNYFWLNYKTWKAAVKLLPRVLLSQICRQFFSSSQKSTMYCVGIISHHQQPESHLLSLNNMSEFVIDKGRQWSDSGPIKRSLSDFDDRHHFHGT